MKQKWGTQKIITSVDIQDYLTPIKMYRFVTINVIQDYLKVNNIYIFFYIY